ncbi:MAG: glycosyltransferase family 1 protein [Puniceicoccaceae bacterium]|nr:MAG: glycosyltransferase family 1 protein [Puniceicoccaceae bacterium]
MKTTTSRKPRRRIKDRIAMVSTHGYVAAEPPLGAPDTGGQVVFVLELSKKLAQLGYKVDIWTRQFEDQPATEKVNADVRILRAPCGGKDFIPKEYLYKKLPEWGEHALRRIKKEKLNYQFLNSHYWDAGLAGEHLSGVLSIPHIHTPHSIGTWKKRQMETDFPDNQESFEEKYNFSRRIHHERILYQEADLVIATTPPQLDMLKEDYELRPSKLRMIPPGYDDNRFYPVSEATRTVLREKFNFRGKTIVSLGRLAHNKGFDLLIHAFSLVAEREADAYLTLAVGTSNESVTEQGLLEELRKLIADYNLHDRVTLTGSVSEEDLPDFYRAADVFVLSSRYEPFGMTAIEAMACGTPTVMTTHGGLHRAVNFGEHALYCDTFDKEDFGITLLKPLRYRGLHLRMSQTGANRVRSLFTWTGIAQQLLSAVEARESGPFSFSGLSGGHNWSEYAD